MTQLKNADLAAGKTIKELIVTGDSSRAVIKFDDGEYIVLCIRVYWDEDRSIAVDEDPLDMYEKLHFGFITQDEFDKMYLKVREREMKKAEEYERKQYERLREKYGHETK